MRQAITTRYHGATDRTGSRISATAQAGKVFVGYDDGLSANENHLRAALKLCAKHGWSGPLAVGGLPDGRGNVYAFIDSDVYVVPEKTSDAAPTPKGWDRIEGSSEGSKL